MQDRSIKGDGLDLHHFPQKKPASHVIENYDPNTAPAIATPKEIHKSIPTQKGTYTGTARDLVATDAKNARNAGVPRETIQEAIAKAKQKYPASLDKKQTN